MLLFRQTLRLFFLKTEKNTSINFEKYVKCNNTYKIVLHKKRYLLLVNIPDNRMLWIAILTQIINNLRY